MSDFDAADVTWDPVPIGADPVVVVVAAAGEKPQGAVAKFDAAVDELRAAVRREIDRLIAWLDRPTRYLLLALVLSVPSIVAFIVDLGF